MAYIILNCVKSTDITGLLISKLPPISKPKIRVNTTEIDGVDGDIITKLGYSAYDKTISIGLSYNYDLNEVISFFNSDGVVTFSDEPNKYYKYQIINQIDFEKLIRFKTAEVTLHCQPFKYSTTEEPIAIDAVNTDGTGSNITLENTENGGAFNTINILGDTEQDGTPTPSSPVDVNVVSGDNTINICGKNLLFNTIASLKSQNINGIWDNNVYTLSGVAFTINDDLSIKVNGSSSQALFFLTNNSWSYSSNLLTLEAGTYTFSCQNATENCRLDFNIYYSNGTNQFKMINNNGSITLTFNETIKLNIRLEVVNNVNVNTTLYPMIEKGSTATDFEPYQSQSYAVNLPVENLFDGEVELGSINTSGNTPTNNALRSVNYIKVKPNTQYTINNNLNYTTRIYEYNNDKTYITNSSQASTTYTFTTSATTEYIRFRTLEGATQNNLNIKVMLELGSKANSFTPYGTTPIELCKIGTYQDKIYKEDGKWYLHKEIGKVVLDGTQNITLATSGTRRFNATYTTLGITNIKDGSSNIDTANYRMNDHFIYGSSNNIWGNYYMYSNWLVLFDTNSTIASANDLKTWFTNNQTTIYYVLATPTNTEITDETLLSQLNALGNATTYLGVTNITTSGNDLPPIIYASANAMDSDISVTNSGNIYSKPRITIFGTGVIGLYLNGVQIFNIEMGTNEGYITIDVAEMEAYKDNLSNLKNRLVTGNYDNFILPVGTNTISYSGNLLGIIVENYSRWL